MVSAQQMYLLLANTSQNDTVLTKVCMTIDRTISQCLRWRGHLPFYLLLIIYNYIMNAIMNFVTLYVCQIAFVQYFTHFGHLFLSILVAVTPNLHAHLWQVCAPSFHWSSLYDLSNWLFSELRSKACVDRYRACRPQVLSVKRSKMCPHYPRSNWQQ